MNSIQLKLGGFCQTGESSCIGDTYSPATILHIHHIISQILLRWIQHHSAANCAIRVIRAQVSRGRTVNESC